MTAVGCVAPQPSIDERQEAVHGTGASGIDAAWPAVGFLTGNSTSVHPTIPNDPNDPTHQNELSALDARWCSGTLVGPRTVLTASHCVEWILDKCGGGGTWDGLRFALNPSGDGRNHPENTVVYKVDDVHINPASHGAWDGSCPDNERARLDSNHDEAILHLAVESYQPEPSTIATPMPMLTSLADQNDSPFGVHRTVDMTAFRAGTNLQPDEVGWETADPDARHAASTTFVTGQDFNAVIQYVNSTAVATGGGDSGAGAVLASYGSSGNNSIPQGAYIVGDLYGGDSQSSWYPNTFNAGHREWLESEMWYHDDHEIAPTYTPPTYTGLTWKAVDTGAGETPPVDYWVGGQDGATPLGLCVAWYEGGQHPGKLFNGGCSYGWGGAERWAAVFKVLEVAPGAGLSWVARANAQTPNCAVATGFENGGPLYACRAQYAGGTHPGKRIGSTCNIGWGGSEIPLSSYDMLCQSAINRIDTASGSIAGGTYLTLYGNGFDTAAGGTRVWFGGVESDYVNCDRSTSCYVRSPRASGYGGVYITFSAFGVTSSPTGAAWFEYVPAALQSISYYAPTASVSLNGYAPAGGVSVVFASGDPNALAAPAALWIPPGSSGGSVAVTTLPIDHPETVTLTASDGSVNVSTPISLFAWPVFSIQLGTAVLAQNASTTLAVSLASAAPAGGATVTLSSSDPAAVAVPATATIAAGSHQAIVPITNSYGGAPKDVTLTASYGGLTTTGSISVPSDTSCVQQTCQAGWYWNSADCLCEQGPPQ